MTNTDQVRTKKRRVSSDVRQRRTTIHNYQKQANATSGTSGEIDAEMLARASNAADLLMFHFKKLAKVCIEIDKVKRYIFYGDKTQEVGILNRRTEVSGPGRKVGSLTIMETLNFQKLARHIHGVTGVCTEAGELAESVIGCLSSGKIDEVNFKEELGDLEWYIAECANAAYISLLEVLTSNINKLRKRYPEKFGVDEALHRDLHAERDALIDDDDELNEPNLRDALIAVDEQDEDPEAERVAFGGPMNDEEQPGPGLGNDFD